MSNEVDELRARLAKLESQLAFVRQARDGRDGRDGKDADPALPGDRGERGPAGKDGRDGRDGRDADSEFLKAAFTEAIAEIELPLQGKDGRDASPEDIAAAVARHLAEHPPAAGRDGSIGKDGARGPKGDRGDKGERGDQGEMGPRPDHEWDGTKLRFERASGLWGEYVDLRGPKGDDGGGGRLPKNAGAGTLRIPDGFDLDSLGMANPAITPEEIIVKQNGVWLRMTWASFVDLLPTGTPGPDLYADDYATNYA